MPQSLSNVLVHMVYSTKHRKPWLKDAGVRAELFAYTATILKTNVDSPALIIGGVADHVHLLCLLSRKQALMDVVQQSKTETSKWMKKQGAKFNEFQWQAGYGAFSVSQSNVEQVKHYIATQEEHHRKMSFQEEFREICRRHGIAIDERYAWE
jgi:REP element-mobilizing transposase RayT